LPKNNHPVGKAAAQMKLAATEKDILYKSVNTYQVNLANTTQVIYLAKATLEDIEAVSSVLTCDWLNFWDQRDPGCEEIIKLECDGKIQGLIHFAKYP
jgi:hypothetical protein